MALTLERQIGAPVALGTHVKPIRPPPPACAHCCSALLRGLIRQRLSLHVLKCPRVQLRDNNESTMGGWSTTNVPRMYLVLCAAESQRIFQHVIQRRHDRFSSTAHKCLVHYRVQVLRVSVDYFVERHGRLHFRVKSLPRRLQHLVSKNTITTCNAPTNPQPHALTSNQMYVDNVEMKC